MLFTRIVAVILIYALLASQNIALAQIRLPSTANIPTPQSLFQEALGYFVKQKIGNTLPIKLDASKALPTVPNAQLPGGPFHGTPLVPTAENVSHPLAPGDYEIRVMAYCTQFSVHRPGQNAATVLAPLEGTQAKTIGNLLTRGTQAGKNPQELQNVAWAIQNGLSFEQMPKSYQDDITTLVPEGRAGLEQGFSIDRPVREVYNDIFANPRKYMLEYKHEKGWKWPDMLVPNIRIAAPPFDQFIASLGPIGRAYVGAEQDRQTFIRNIEAQQHGQERPFVATTNPPLPPIQGPWTVWVPGRAYMRVIIQGGNMKGDNILQLRVLPASPRAYQGSGQAPLIYASYRPAVALQIQMTAPRFGITLLEIGEAEFIAYSLIAAQALIIVLNAINNPNNKSQPPPPPPIPGPRTATGAPPQPGGGDSDCKPNEKDCTNGRQWTARNFRQNLADETGENPPDKDAHHIFPQKFEDFFSKNDININDPDYGSWWTRGSHQAEASAYNQAWEDFMESNPTANRQEILNFGRQLAREYGQTVRF